MLPARYKLLRGGWFEPKEHRGAVWSLGVRGTACLYFSFKSVFNCDFDVLIRISQKNEVMEQEHKKDARKEPMRDVLDVSTFLFLHVLLLVLFLKTF